jgi:hypothetical protein
MLREPSMPLMSKPKSAMIHLEPQHTARATNRHISNPSYATSEPDLSLEDATNGLCAFCTVFGGSCGALSTSLAPFVSVGTSPRTQRLHTFSLHSKARESLCMPAFALLFFALVDFEPAAPRTPPSVSVLSECRVWNVHRRSLHSLRIAHRPQAKHLL